MLRSTIAGILWLVLYLSVVTIPILVFLSGSVPAARPFWIEFGVLLGFGLLLLLALQFWMTARFDKIGKPFGTDTLLLFHRHAGILVLLFLLGHPLILFIAKPKYLDFLDPSVNALRAIFLVLASLAMVMIVVLSVWRKSFGLNFEWWRLSHGAMAAGVMIVGLAHAWQVGHYVSGWGKRALLIGIVATAVGSFIYTRFGRAWLARRYPYRVVDIRNEAGEVSTIVLEPKGHSGMTFRSGQYAWISLGRSLFTMQQNPYSFSGSDQDAPLRLEFTVKDLGDFSDRIAHVDEEHLAYLDGPFGSFCLDDNAPGAVFIMGGIGITPAISILRSLRDRNDQRPVLLIYGNTNLYEVAFFTELNELSKQLDLRVVHVLNEADSDWQGETGYITREILEKYLSKEDRMFPFFVCGPLPMMDAVETALLELKIPLSRIHAERFDMV